ncbi:hypothetical protein [Conexibacter sp. S30A1]|uniref:hypothetical protein n=1 Tax=Conexibacter sp. S30A1 TaxID=2937800 RepID=UPI002010B971|nr:hypothetical protein [Conexibacter sp. S30A1]
MSRIRALLRFLWDFVVGDDWRIAAAVVVALAATLVVSESSIPVWWLLPLVVVVILSISVWDVARRRS